MCLKEIKIISIIAISIKFCRLHAEKRFIIFPQKCEREMLVFWSSQAFNAKCALDQEKCRKKLQASFSINILRFPSEWLMSSNYIYDSRAPRTACARHGGEEFPSETTALDTRKLENGFLHMRSANFPPALGRKIVFKILVIKWNVRLSL